MERDKKETPLIKLHGVSSEEEMEMLSMSNSNKGNTLNHRNQHLNFSEDEDDNV